MIDKKLFHLAWIGAVVVLLLVGLVIGLRSGDVTVYDREYIWSAETGTDENAPVNLVRGRRVQSIQQDMHKLLFALNKTFVDAETPRLQSGETALELPKLVLQGHERTTARVVVENSGYLTQRMGSAGAQDFLAAATFTLTECPVITAVDFDFPVGDHATPGVYTRMSFTGYKTVYGRK